MTSLALAPPQTPPRSPWWQRSRGLLLLCGLLLTALVAVLRLQTPLIVQDVELRLYDMLRSARPAPPPSGVPVLVGIDEASLARYGQWPWPRYRLATLVDRLREQGASVIALDFLLPEPDRSSPEVVQAERARDGLGGSVVESGRDSNSARLAQALAGTRSVLGYYLSFDAATAAGSSPPPPPEGVLFSAAPGSAPGWPLVGAQLRSLPLLRAAAQGEGFTNAVHDADGVLRRVPLILAPDREVRLSLSLTALLLHGQARSLQLTGGPGESQLLWDGKRIPLDPAGNLLVDFRPGGSVFPYFSAGGLLGPSPLRPDLRGRIVIVGVAATGLGDRHVVSGGDALQGMEVHATLIENLLGGKFISRPAWAVAAELLAIVVLGGLASLLLAAYGASVALAAALLGCLLPYLLSWTLMREYGLHLSPLLPMLAPLLVTACLGLLKYGIEVRRVRLRTRDLVEAQDTVIVAMSALAEARDNETGQHLLRTQRYVGLLARQLAKTAKYAELTSSDIELLAKSAPLHDIGKVGIPDSILRKPGKLTADEYKIMQAHPLIGAEALSRIIETTGHPERHAFLNYARQMIESHHERWDGTGYPYGLRGETIPLAGRLMALADVYDALISRRVYKQGYSHGLARDFIRANAGSHFDPDVVAAFLAVEPGFAEIARRFADEPVAVAA